MLRRILYIGFVLTLIAGVGYFYWSYQKKRNFVSNFSEFAIVPSNSSLLLTINSLEHLKEEVSGEGEMLATLRQLPFFARISQTISKLDSVVGKDEELTRLIKGGVIHLAWSSESKNDTIPLLVFSFKNANKANKVWNALQANVASAVKNSKVDGTQIIALHFKELETQKIYAFATENVVVLSAALSVIKQSITGLEGAGNLANDDNFNKIRLTSGRLSAMNVYLNLERISGMGKLWGSDQQDFAEYDQKIGSWVELDLNLQEKSIMLNGFGSSSQQKVFFDLLQKMEPIKYSSPEVLPVSVGDFSILGISDVARFREFFPAYRNNDSIHIQHRESLSEWNNLVDTNLVTFFDQLLNKEICSVYSAQIASQDTLDRLVVLKVESGLNAEDGYLKLLAAYANKKDIKLRTLISKIQADYKTEVNSYFFPFNGILSHLYGDVIKDQNLERVCFYNNYLLLAYNHEAIQNVIFENMRNRTLVNDQNYIEFSESIAEHANFFWFTKMPQWREKMANVSSSQVAEQLSVNGQVWSKFYALGLQLTALNNLIYSTAYLQYKPEMQVKPKTIWESKLAAEIQMKPVWVVNHYTGENEFCVQDTSNILYLINDAGIILWEKQLDSPIVGTIEQIDAYKNGKLQLLFSTQNKLVLLDRNGNFVGRFPVNFAAKTTSGASVHDYNGKKDYRIFVPCENGRIYLYDRKGQIVNGWSFSRSDHWVNQPVKHFRADNRDFIVFKDKARLYIQDRRGRVRVKPKKTFAPSVNSEIYLDKNGRVGRERFVTTDENGTVKYIYIDGTVRENKLITCTPQHTYVYNDIDGDGKGDHLFLDKGKLSVFHNDGTEMFLHDFSSASLKGPAIYTFGPKNIKIGVTDIQNERIYLFNMDGSQYEGFPVTGKTDFSIGYLGAADWRFGLTVGGRSGYLLYYKVK